MRSSVVKSKAFGKDTNPTIYYLVGYGSTIATFQKHIKALALAGFRVVAFEYDRAIIDAGDPELLVQSLQKIVDTIQKDRQDRKVAGTFGISLGTWLGFNVMIMTGIKSGYFISGGVSIVEAIWSKDSLSAAKHGFEANGFSKSKLHDALKAYDFNEDSSRMKDIHYVLVKSTADNVIDFEEANRNFKSWQKTNPKSQQIIYKRYNHWQVIVRGLFNVRSVVSFFKKASLEA